MKKVVLMLTEEEHMVLKSILGAKEFSIPFNLAAYLARIQQEVNEARAVAADEENDE